jgi:NAD(P)H dehydrogenase (quinone)
MATYLSEISGKTIQYVSPSADEYTATLAGFGVPAEAIGIFTSFAVAQAKGELDTESNDLEDLLGRKPVSVRSFLSDLYSGSSAKQ